MGIDPGLRHTGWGIIDVRSGGAICVDFGVVVTDANLSLADRLGHLHKGIHALLDQFSPQEISIEETFLNPNPASTLKLGMARGAIMAAPAARGIPIFEYTANRIKKAVVGQGHATKDQIARMIKILLPSAQGAFLDAADALAAALCHAHCRSSLMKGYAS